jgi:hypothetical protein
MEDSTVQISSMARIAHPLERVYLTYRDDLPSLAAYLPDVSRIVVEERVEREGGVDQLNIWHASTRIPSVVKAFVRPEMLSWEDHARWDDAATLARWTLVVPALRNQVTCTGETRIRADPMGCQVEVVGDLQIDLSRLPGMNRFVGKRLVPQIEAFISQLIAPNVERVNAALGRYLDDKHGKN